MKIERLDACIEDCCPQIQTHTANYIITYGITVYGSVQDRAPHGLIP